jgi:hypothetical protein
MFENSGSFQKLWVVDANYYDGIILKPNSINNILSLADDYQAIEIPFTLDTATYKYSINQEKNVHVTTATVSCSLPFKESNQILIQGLPPKKLIIIKDYEGNHLLFGNDKEPMLFDHDLKANPDFNKGKFFKLEFSRKLKTKPIFISDPFAESSGSGIA